MDASVNDESLQSDEENKNLTDNYTSNCVKMLHKGSNMPEFVLNCEREHPLLCAVCKCLIKTKTKKTLFVLTKTDINVPALSLHFNAGVEEMWEAAVSICNALSDSLSCSSREEDRARATMVSSSSSSGFFLGFFLAGRPGLDGPFLLVPPVSMLEGKR